MKGKKIVPHVVAQALLIIIVYVVRLVWKVEIPAEVGMAGSTVLAVLISAIVPDSIEADAEETQP
jgi:hypothetical protein